MRAIVILLFLCFSTTCAFANGGSISDGSFVRGSSSITLINEKNFKLLSEYLSFHIQGDYINVNVVYHIQNLGESKSIKYGFAVDYRDNQRHNFKWEDDYIQNFTIINNAQQLNISTKTEKNVRIEQCDYSKWDTPAEKDTISRKWFISDLYFEQGETKLLIVTYQIKANYADWGRQDYPGDKYYPASLSNRLFRYFLKPSGFWGDGKVENFTLKITFDNIDKYSIFETTGISDLKKLGNSYVYETNNFDLLQNDYLKIDYNYSEWLSTQEAIGYNKSKKIVKSIKCLTQQDKYPISNLIDCDKNTAYVPLILEKGNNWIEIVFNDSVNVYGIGIINGYTKSKSTYFDNNIVVELKVSIVFSNETLEKYVYLTRKSSSNDYSQYFAGIEDIIWGDLLNNYNDEEQNRGNALSMKIEILKTSCGAKYKDTCISELMIYGEKY